MCATFCPTRFSIFASPQATVMRISIDIPDAGDGQITGDRESLLLLIEGARRDLNACAQAQGGSSEWKARYGRLSAELTRLSAGVPRANLFAADPLAGIGPTVLIRPGEDRAALFAAAEECMADGAGDSDLEDLLS